MFPPVQLIGPTTTDGGVTSRRVNCANCSKVTIIVDLVQGAGHNTDINLMQATAVTGGFTAGGPASPTWVNEDCAASDFRTRGAAWASTVTVDDNAKSKQVIFEVDPVLLRDGYKYLFVTASASAEAANFMSAHALLHRAFQSDPPATAVT
jgi:hypothetical protein